MLNPSQISIRIDFFNPLFLTKKSSLWGSVFCSFAAICCSKIYDKFSKGYFKQTLQTVIVCHIGVFILEKIEDHRQRSRAPLQACVSFPQGDIRFTSELDDIIKNVRIKKITLAFVRSSNDFLSHTARQEDKAINSFCAQCISPHFQHSSLTITPNTQGLMVYSYAFFRA